MLGLVIDLQNRAIKFTFIRAIILQPNYPKKLHTYKGGKFSNMTGLTMVKFILRQVYDSLQCPQSQGYVERGNFTKK